MVVGREAYEESIPEAKRRNGRRSPKDVDVLRVPVWSNDNDFEDAGIEWFTTADLLKRLE